MSKKLCSILLAFAMLMLTITNAFAAVQFENVDGSTFKIENLKELGFINGYEDGSLRLDQYIKRSEFAKVLVHAFDKEQEAEAIKGKFKPFKDVDESHWANGIISIVKNLKGVNNTQIINGYPDGTFRPEEHITYAEALKMLVCCVKTDLTEEMYKNAEWFESWVKWAIELGIIGAESDVPNIVDMNAKVTRGNVFTMFYNAFEEDEVERPIEKTEEKEPEKKTEDKKEEKSVAPDRHAGSRHDRYDRYPEYPYYPDLPIVPFEPSVPEVKTYSISIDSIENGIVSADKYSAEEGEIVTLRIIPNEGYKLDTLEVTDAFGNRVQLVNQWFLMPSSNVVVSAKFVEETVKPVEFDKDNIKNIEIKSEPSKMNYVEGEQLNLSGFVVTLTDINDNTVDVDYNDFLEYGIDVEPVDGTVLGLEDNGKQITVSKSEIETKTNQQIVVKEKIKGYAVTVKEPVNGQITVDKETAKKGEEITVTETANDGYKLVEITVTDENNNPVTVTDGSFIMPASDVEVTATYEAIEYTITVDAEANGTVEVAEKANVKEEIEIKVTPNDGFDVKEITAVDKDNNPITVENNKFTMPASNVTVKVTFEEKEYNVKTVAPTNGQITVDKETAKKGEEITVEETANDGYKLVEITVTDENNNPVTVTDGSFIMPASDVEVTATFKAIDYVITVDTDTNKGTVNVTGTPNVGKPIEINVTPKEGYEVDGKITAVDKDNNPITVKEDNSFTMPASDVTVKVTFKQKEYKVEIENSENGSVEANPKSGVAGTQITLDIKPETGYELDTIKATDGEGQEVPVDKENKNFTMPTSDVKVIATFKKSVYEVKVEAADNGTVTANTETASINDKITLEITPDKGYELEALTVKTENGETVDVKDNSFTMPASNVTITATFKQKEYKVEIENSENGSVEANPKSGVAGTTIALDIKPETGYELDTIKATDGEGQEVPVDKENKNFTMPTSDVKVIATFKEIEYTITVANTENGKATANKETATINEEIEITTEPAEHFKVETIKVTDTEGKTIDVKDDIFKMPASNVTVNVKFREKGRIDILYKNVWINNTNWEAATGLPTLEQYEEDSIWKYPKNTVNISGADIPLQQEGFEFIGWKTEDGKEIRESFIINKNMVLIAQWKDLTQDEKDFLKEQFEEAFKTAIKNVENKNAGNLKLIYNAKSVDIYVDKDGLDTSSKKLIEELKYLIENKSLVKYTIGDKSTELNKEQTNDQILKLIVDDFAKMANVDVQSLNYLNDAEVEIKVKEILFALGKKNKKVGLTVTLQNDKATTTDDYTLKFHNFTAMTNEEKEKYETFFETNLDRVIASVKQQGMTEIDPKTGDKVKIPVFDPSYNSESNLYKLDINTKYFDTLASGTGGTGFKTAMVDFLTGGHVGKNGIVQKDLQQVKITTLNKSIVLPREELEKIIHIDPKNKPGEALDLLESFVKVFMPEGKRIYSLTLADLANQKAEFEYTYIDANQKKGVIKRTLEFGTFYTDKPRGK